MNVFYLILLLLISPIYSWAMSLDEVQVDVWEKAALQEIKKYGPKNPEKEFFLYMIAGRELSNYGLKDKSINYYQKAYQHSYKGDKTEAVIQLVNLNRDNKEQLTKALSQADKWFTENPKKYSPQLRQWLHMMKGYAKGETPYVNQGFNKIWAVDSRVSELMKEGKAQEAYELLGPMNLNDSNINQKIRQDLLAAASLGKKSSPPLWCLPTLKKYPTSLTWSMRICRYLDDWKKDKKSEESLESIKIQLQKENPERLYWMTILEKL